MSVLVLLSAGFAAGCENGPTEPTTPSGTIRATYSGFIQGEFVADGAYRSTPLTTYALAYDIPDSNDGAVRIGGEEYDGVAGQSLVLTLNTLQPGTYDIGEDCDAATGNCAYGLFQDDDDVRDAEPDQPYAFVGGSVTVTAVTDGRIRGSFEVQAQGYDPESLADIKGAAVAFTSGTFDVPIVALPTN